MADTKFSPDRNITWPSGHDPSSARVFAQNVIEINADAEVVWKVLVDCTAWPNWYKHCSDVSLLHGESLSSRGSKFRFKTLGSYFEPVVDICEPPHMLVWSASGPLGTSGAHAWLIEPTPEGCRVTTEEAQKGIFLYLVASRVRGMLLECHEEWLRALKELAEKEAASFYHEEMISRKAARLAKKSTQPAVDA